MKKTLDLGKEAILPLILKMSWPSIIAMTAMSLYNFIDTFWLARLSSQALAALTVCFPIQLIAAAIGRRNRHRRRFVFRENVRRREDS